MPEKPVGQAPPISRQIRAILTMSWLNLLLPCIPVCWALHFVSKNDTLVFVFSFLSIIPLAKLLSFASDELSIRVGCTLARLLQVTLGNVVELIIAFIALVHCELQIVQASLVGSILSNLFLVLGFCFLIGGFQFSEQGFGISVTQLNASLLMIFVVAVLIPSVFYLVADSSIEDLQESADILSISRGFAIILLFIYGLYLVFQLFSHKALFNEKYADVSESTPYTVRKRRKTVAQPDRFSEIGHSTSSTSVAGEHMQSSPNASISHQNNFEASRSADLEAHPAAQGEEEEEEEEEIEVPQMSVLMTIGLLIIVTVLIAATAEWLVESINGLVAAKNISREFLGLIVLPLVGNIAEHWPEHITAVATSLKDKLTLSLIVAVGSSIQIALFIIPFVILVGWVMGKPVSLPLDPLESIVLFLSVILVNYVIQNGKSNWLKGMLLISLYVILAVTFWYYPGINVLGRLLMC